MEGDIVPDSDHISRYCSGSKLKEDGTPSGVAFRLRMTKGQLEEYLSVNWLEFLDKNDREEEIREIRKVLATKFQVGSTAKIAVLDVGETREYVFRNSEDARNLLVKHVPEDEGPLDPSHSGIYNLKQEDVLIADMIAQLCKETHSAK